MSQKKYVQISDVARKVASNIFSKMKITLELNRRKPTTPITRIIIYLQKLIESRKINISPIKQITIIVNHFAIIIIILSMFTYHISE